MTSIKGRYARIEIPLDKAETRKELFLSGDYLNIISITGEGTCEIKLDHRHSQTLDLREISKITGYFERVYLTTDGKGGICTLYIGTGIAINVISNPQKLWSGGSISTQITTTDAVQSLASAPLRLYDVTILNEGLTGFPVYVGPYNSDLAIFRAHAYMILAEKTLKFTKKDMYSLATASYDAVNHETIYIIGTYE